MGEALRDFSHARGFYIQDDFTSAMFSASSAKKLQTVKAEMAQKSAPRKNRQQAEKNFENARRTFRAVLIYRVPEIELEKFQPSVHFEDYSESLQQTFAYYR